MSGRGEWFDVKSNLEALSKQMGLVDDKIRYISEYLHNERLLERHVENAHHEVRFDTNLSTAPRQIDVVKLFGGYPATSLSVLDIGGGNLQVQLPDMAEPFAVEITDTFKDELISGFQLSVSATAPGTARIRLGAYIPQR